MGINLHTVLGAIIFILGAVQTLPAIRHRAEERGFSGGVAVPLILSVIGFGVFMVGVFAGGG